MASLKDKSWAIKSTKLPKEEIDEELSDLFHLEKNDGSTNIDESSNDIVSPGLNTTTFTFKTMHDMDSLHSRQSMGSSTVDANFAYSMGKPLSWREARTKLCNVLKCYISSSREDMVSCGTDKQVCEKDVDKTNVWFLNNLDCYFGSILCSLALLVLSVTLYIRNDRDERDSIQDGSNETLNSSLRLYQSHIIGSTLLFSGSMLSVWFLRRRCISNARGAETKKRHAIETFLPVLQELINCKGDHENSLTEEEKKPLQQNIPGTSLTDIYPVYRLDGDGRNGKWHKIPSLLLVEGDFIALQLGDTAPADCKLVTGNKLGSSAPRNLSAPNLRAMGASGASSFQPKVPHREQVILKAGDRVELSPRLKLENRGNIQVCDPLFLPGKSKISEHSKKLLYLTNHSKVFKVLKSPIATFLRKKTGKVRFFCSILPIVISHNYLIISILLKQCQRTHH
jgi:Cation transport ATPase